MEAEIRWHPGIVEVVAKTLGNQMKVGGLWETMRPALTKKAEAILTALLREGYEVRRAEEDGDPPPAPLAADPALITEIPRF